ncbi:MAG: hypothetical protein AB7P33_07440 [Dehalococcoidia bacterium]
MSRAIAISGFLLTVLIAAACVSLIAITWAEPTGTGTSLPRPIMAIGFIASALVYSALGLVLALKRPENLIGWLFLADGVLSSLDIAHGRYQLYTLIYRPDTQLPQLLGTAGLVDALWIAPMSLTVLTLILFPEGKLGRAQSRAAAAIGLLTIAAIVLHMIEPGPFSPPLDVRQNPLGITAYEDFSFLADLLILPIALAGLVAAGNLLRRLFASTGDEHEQIKWFAYVAGWLPLIVVAYLVVGVLGITDQTTLDLLTASTILLAAALPLAIGIAILKYRLYDIDVLVNRTLVYVPLTAILAGLFTATTGLSRAVFTEVSGAASDTAVAVSTLAVVAFFTPVKNLLQSVVDRRFKETSDPSKPLLTLASDARKVFGVLDSEEFLRQFAEKTTIALGAANALIYLNGRMTPVIVSGDPLAAPVLSFPLIESGTHVGRLEVGPRTQLRAYSPQQITAVEKQTDVLARGLVFFAAANGLQIERPDQGGPGVADSMIGAL